MVKTDVFRVVAAVLLIGLLVIVGEVIVPLPDPPAVTGVLDVKLVAGRGDALPSPLPLPVGPGAGLSVGEVIGYGGMSFFADPVGSGGRFMVGCAGMIMVTIELVMSW